MRDLWEHPGRRVGRAVFVLPSVDSTNALAMRVRKPGIGYLADEQTAGRGQHGRVWSAPPRSSVLLSVTLPPGVERAAILTAWAAVCVAEVARRLTGIPPRLKWPNDVLLNGKKLAGILIERSGDGPFVAGIGLNVRQNAADFAAAGLPDATSLRATGADVETDDVARLLLRLLDEEFGRILADGPGALEATWRELLALVGEEARADCAGIVHEGRVVDVRFDGVVLATGVTLAPERITRLIALPARE